MILVLGATGFVGPKIAHALRAENRPVRCLVRKPDSDAARTLVNWGCEVVRGDLTDPESLRHAISGCDTVIHFVAIIVGSREKFERVMVQGTRDLVAAAKEEGVERLVLMSALGTNERSREVTRYFGAKWQEEQAVKGSGIDYTIFRPSFVFGRDGGMLRELIRQVRYSPVITVVGTRRLQPIWIDDLAQFFVRSLSTPGAVNRTFELGGPDQVTWDELYDRLRRLTGKRRATVHVPVGLARAGAAVAELLPPLSGAREALTMLELADSVTDISPAVETFGIRPISLDEQIRRAL